MHFFNPVHRMPLVEIIRGEQTSDETINRVVAYAAAMGKSPVVVNDCPGFRSTACCSPLLRLQQAGRRWPTSAAVDKVG